MANRTRKWTDEQLIEAVKTSTYLIEVGRKLGLSSATDLMKTRIVELKLDISHFGLPKHQAGKAKIYSDSEVFIKDTRTNHVHVKRRAIEQGYVVNKCYWCGVEEEWNGKSITLELDHINGDNKDNRIENLRILCPNCHSQTETYKGRNGLLKPPKKCAVCQKRIRQTSTYCLKHKPRKYEVDWPSNEELRELAKTVSLNEMAKKFNVSYWCMRKKIKKVEWSTCWYAV